MSNITDALERQAELLYQNVAGWETRTLEYIGARIKKTGRMSMADVQQLNNMAVVKQDMDVIIKDLARITGQNVSAIEQIYGEVIDSQHNANKALYDYRNKPFVPFKDNRRLQALVKAYSRVTAGTMINLSKTKALGFVDELGRFSNIQDALYKTLGRAVVEVSSGSTDFNTAMRRTIEQLGGSGIRVDYGSGITRRLDTVVRQNLLYGAKQASTEYNEMIGEELGCDGIEIDWHSNPRPSHEFMQGKQYSLEGKKTIRGVTYESADAALAALEEYGCLHFKTPIICGVSEPAYSPEQLKELNRKNKEPVTVDGVTKNGYEWKQAMRRLETEARNTKDQLTMFKASGDVEGARKCRVRLKAINEKYNSIADRTGIKAQPEKMRSIGASSGSKVAKNYSKPLENGGRSGIIDTYRHVVSRKMASGMRMSPSHVLTEEEVKNLKLDIKAIGADESVFIFNRGRYTGYNDKTDKIKVRGDVLPDKSSNHPRDLMSSRAVLAHEYYGHRAYRGTKLPKGAWNDEFRASYMAAKNTPNLSDEDRRYLVLDALERAKEKGITIKHNDFIRRILYGY